MNSVATKLIICRPLICPGTVGAKPEMKSSKVLPPQKFMPSKYFYDEYGYGPF